MLEKLNYQEENTGCKFYVAKHKQKWLMENLTILFSVYLIGLDILGFIASNGNINYINAAYTIDGTSEEDRQHDDGEDF